MPEGNRSLRMRQTKGGLALTAEGDAAVDVLEQRRSPRPHLHPLRPLDGSGILTEDAPAHHPWQHGVYCGLHDVGDSDFWFDAGQRDQAGEIVAEPPRVLASDRRCVSWQVEAAWLAHDDGRPLLRETQQWSATLVGSTWRLTLGWTLRAAEALTIAAHAYGGLFLRMPFEEGCNPAALNANGQRDGACEQQDAAWALVTMDIAGRDRPAGWLVSQHPANPLPWRWRLDGQFGLGPVVVADPLVFAAGQTRRWRYGLTCLPDRTEAATAERYHRAYVEDAVE